MKLTNLIFLILILAGVALMSSRDIKENKYTGYIVVEGCGLKEGLNQLRERVNIQIGQGWEPSGGIETQVDSYSTCYYQAMVR